MVSLEGIAVDAAKGALNLVLAKAVDEIKLTWGFKDDLKKLKERLTMIQALLEDAGAKRALSNLEQLWMEKVKKVTRHADDLFDEFAFEHLRRKLEIKDRYYDKGRFKARYFFFLCLSNPLGFQLRMAHQVRDLMALIDEVFLEASNFGLRAINLVTPGNDGSSGTVSLMFGELHQRREVVDARQVIGRDVDEASVVEALCSYNNADDLPFVVVVGIAGIGKTTLARRVYGNEAVISSFAQRMWICVSDDFNINKILSQMAEQLDKSRPDLTNTEALVKKLEEQLGAVKYLLVLDDVWNTVEELWDSLKSCLHRIGGATGSVVLVTTRSTDVAVSMKASFVHRLKGLSREKSWDLFKQTVFGNDQECPSNLEPNGRKIVRKCKGVPLAIKTMGVTLRQKRVQHYWESIANSELWKLPDYGHRVLPSLLLSFQHLPSPYLKQCFAYCAIFPKGLILTKQVLVTLWMAQGFLCPPKGSSLKMEEIGENYFNILLNHSFLRFEDQDEFQDSWSIPCRMHDLVHDLARFVSRHDVLMCEVGGSMDEDSSISHLAISYDMENQVSAPSMMKIMSNRLRTIQSWVNIPNDLLMQARYLRVLTLRGVGLTKVPDMVGELKLLRYLDLSFNQIEELPESITTLYYLQMLRLEGCNSLFKLPNGIGKLINLRHLVTDTSVEVPIGIERLTALQTLPALQLSASDGVCRLNELGCLHDLTGLLQVFGLQHVKSKDEAQKACIGSKAGVSSLRLKWTSHEIDEDSRITEQEVLDGLQPHPNLQRLDVLDFNGESLPSWLRRMAVVSSENSQLVSFDSLVILELRNFHRCNHLPMLGQLQVLKILVIDAVVEITEIGTEFYTHSSGNDVEPGFSSSALFPALKMLHILRCPNLAAWLEPRTTNLSQVSFPCLEELSIIDCPLLTTTPSDFPTLRRLMLKGIRSAQPLHNILTTIACKYGKGNTLASLNVGRVEELTDLPYRLAQQFTSLRTLKIRECHKLACLPDDLGKLTSLKRLIVESCSLLKIFPEIGGPSSLVELVVKDCQELRMTPSTLDGCTALERLVIAVCPKIDLNKRLGEENARDKAEDADSWTGEWLWRLPRLRFCAVGGSGLNQEGEDQPDHFVPDLTPLLNMKSVQALTLYGWPMLECLPEELGRFTSLENLRLIDFDGIEEIPEWMCGLSSLKSLEICNCSNIRQFPSQSAMQRLKHLEYLLIELCPILTERCGKDDGPEWHKISHIKCIEMDGQIIQNLT